MTPHRYEQVVALFRQASELSPEARETFLAETCAATDGLRQEVEAMLSADGLAGDFLENSPGELAAALLSAHYDLPSETVLGDFKILSRLGAGGMGVVYLAEDMRLGRKVALKLLPSDFAGDPGWLSRFEQEARLVSALNHPNIVTVYGISEEGWIHFLATEFVEGQTLRNEMATGPMDPSGAIGIVTQVATALSASHAAGIIHRDIKPENIMLRPDRLVKVLDFGLAKNYRDESASGAIPAGRRVRTEGVLLGTVRYMSPEQARGSKLDPLTDLFSLGVVLYEMIAGHHPFEGETVSDEIAAILKSEPPPFPIDGPVDNAEIDRIVRKALQKNKTDRYQSAQELGSDLTKLKRRLDLRTCSRCGKPLQEGNAFCTGCGLSARAVKCRNCGKMTNGRKCCTSCGKPLRA